MIAAGDEYLKEAANTMFELSADEQIRKQCRDREEYYQDLHNYERVIAQKDAIITEKDMLFQKTITEKDALLQRAETEAERLRALLMQHGINDSE